jgi:biopolymer transport protein ExbB
MNPTGNRHPARDAAVAGDHGGRRRLQALGLGLTLAFAASVSMAAQAQTLVTQDSAPVVSQETAAPDAQGQAQDGSASQASQPGSVAQAPETGMTAAGQGETNRAVTGAPDAQAQRGEGSTAPSATDAVGSADPAAAELALPPSQPGISKAMLPHDLSPWGMFMAADIVVKAVMVSLAFASLITWTVWLAKTFELFVARRRLSEALRVLSTAHSLHDAEKSLAGMKGPVVELARATRAERAASLDLPPEGIKDRAATAMQRIEARAGRTMSVGTGLLATIGSTAPFVGLFGTVWGIMNSFIGISQSQTTNLAVVAPGIAEALLATAIGLIVAIPAVVIYNVFARAITGYRANLGDASAYLMRLLSRDLDREATPGAVVRNMRGEYVAAE